MIEPEAWLEDLNSLVWFEVSKADKSTKEFNQHNVSVMLWQGRTCSMCHV